jgi:hypothetical protein
VVRELVGLRNHWSRVRVPDVAEAKSALLSILSARPIGGRYRGAEFVAVIYSVTDTESERGDGFLTADISGGGNGGNAAVTSSVLRNGIENGAGAN